jgi:hypothetical protein
MNRVLNPDVRIIIQSILKQTRCKQNLDVKKCCAHQKGTSATKFIVYQTKGRAGMRKVLVHSQSPSTDVLFLVPPPKLDPKRQMLSLLGDNGAHWKNVQSLNTSSTQLPKTSRSPSPCSVPNSGPRKSSPRTKERNQGVPIREGPQAESHPCS